MRRMFPAYFAGVLLGSWSLLGFAENVVALGVQDALLASNAAISFREELAKETESADKAVKELEQSARDLQVRAQSSALSNDELERAQLQFQKVYAQFQQQAQSLRALRAEREQAFIAQMRPKLDSVIRQIIEEQKISIIINRQSTIYMEAGVDITPEVVKRLNAL